MIHNAQNEPEKVARGDAAQAVVPSTETPAQASGEVPVEGGPADLIEKVPAPVIPEKRYDLRVLQSLRRIIRAVDIYSRKLAANYQVTGTQLVCLLTIAEEESLTATTIAQRAHLSPSTVIGVLDRLEAKGLVQRERDLNDRRVVNVTATEKGKELADSAPSPLQDTLADALKDLSELEQTNIALALERVVELMEVRHIGAAPILASGALEKEAQAKPSDTQGEK